jgi:UDP-N-acetyl-D-glucosamine dehydrogenase
MHTAPCDAPCHNPSVSFLPERVAIVGQGYVGLLLAMRAAEVGHDVVGFELDSARVRLLADGQSYVEDVPSEQLATALASGRYRPSSDRDSLAGFDIAVITVQTPLRHGTPDLSYIEEAARLVAAHIRPGTCVVLESTTYPGTTEELLGPSLESASGLRVGTDFGLGYSPERIDPGNGTWTLVNTPKVVSGVDEPSLARVQAFYGTLVDRTVAVSGTREAELTKLLENTFRHVNIALVNELAMFAADLEIDVWEAIDAAATKPFGYLRFTPGPGVGGHCLPVDPTYLSWKVHQSLGSRFQFVELANELNAHMPQYVVGRITHGLNARGKPLRGSRILLLGLAFKPDTADTREAPAFEIARQLDALGAEVRAADPHVHEELTPAEGMSPMRVELTPDELRGADAVILVTDHGAFDYGMIEACAPYVFDARHRLSPSPNVEYL